MTLPSRKKPGRSTGAEQLLAAIADLGVEHAFIVPGAHIDPLVVALSNSRRIRGIVCSHEQGAAFMADGYARMRGGIGLCCSIGAPGAANMIPAALTASADRSPVLYLTGNPPAILTGAGAFQDGGGSSGKDRPLFQAVLGSSLDVTNLDQLNPAWERIGQRLLGRPPAPAHLMVRYDVLAGPAEKLGLPENFIASSMVARPGLSTVRMTRRLLMESSRVAVLIGSELGSAVQAAPLVQLAESLCLPVATTAEAKGYFPESHPLHLGMFGYGGSPRAVEGLLRGDLDALLVLGAQLNERNTLCWDPRFFAPERTIVQVRLPVSSTCHSELHRQVQLIENDPAGLLRALIEPDAAGESAVAASVLRTRKRWIGKLRTERPSSEPPVDLDLEEGGMHPARMVMTMREALPSGTVLFLDSGLHRFFANHYWRMTDSDRLYTAANLAPTGWAVAAGIGAALAVPRSRVVILTGDACMLMHGMELAVAARYQAPVTIVISNNGGSGNIYRRMTNDWPEATDFAMLPRVDWAGFARSLGVEALSTNTASELRSALERQSSLTGPCLIEVPTRIGAEPPRPHHSFSSCSPKFLERMARDGKLFRRKLK